MLAQFFLVTDDGGVFKAKDTNKHTKGAREVGETKDTRTDLPIDQVRAEEVKVSWPRGALPLSLTSTRVLNNTLPLYAN